MPEELNSAQRGGTLTVTWRCTPAAFTEEVSLLNVGGHPLEVDGERLFVSLPTTEVNDVQTLKASLDAELRIQLAACLPFTGTKYDLSAPSMTLTEPSGARKHSMAAAMEGVTVTEKADVQIADETGTIIADTRAEREARRTTFVHGIQKYGQHDPTMKAMLASYQESRNDPNYELVCLYEIRDALVARYGSEANVQTALGISNREWKTFGRLANQEPILQSRHRGKFAPNLRGATEDELTEARDAALLMMERYLDTLRANIQ